MARASSTKEVPNIPSTDQNEGATTIADNDAPSGAEAVSDFNNKPAAVESSNPDYKVLDFDNATKLHAALQTILHYHTGSAYRHEFESAVSTLQTFGYTVNSDRADVEANMIQNRTLANESGD